MVEVRNNGVPLIEQAPKAAITQSIIALADALSGDKRTRGRRGAAKSTLGKLAEPLACGKSGKAARPANKPSADRWQRAARTVCRRSMRGLGLARFAAQARASTQAPAVLHGTSPPSVPVPITPDVLARRPAVQSASMCYGSAVVGRGPLVFRHALLPDELNRLWFRSARRDSRLAAPEAFDADPTGVPIPSEGEQSDMALKVAPLRRRRREGKPSSKSSSA